MTPYLVSTHPELGYTGSGINGASYTAAAALYKNLGYAPEGYDMIDNDGNGLVDDWAEGISGGNSAQIVANLKAHKHNTARAEMLYAILVEGAGPLGSVFNRDDFTDKEVAIPTATACPSSLTPGASRSSSSAGRCFTTPTSSAGRRSSPPPPR